MKTRGKIDLKKIDFVMIQVMALLIAAGLYCVKMAQKVSEKKDSIFTKQIAGVVIGVVAIGVIVLLGYRLICSLSPLIYIAVVVLLAATLVIGVDSRNVRRWINIAGISFQPSELAKIALILFLAYLCNHFRDKLDKLYVFLILAAVTVIPVSLILLEPHLSSSVVIVFIFCVIVFASGMSMKVIGTVVGICVPLICMVLASVILFNVDLPFISKYQVNRVTSFLAGDEEDTNGAKDQQNKSVAAIQSGGSYGKIFAQDKGYASYEGLYSNESDFIFAIAGEEFGFVGCCILIALYFILVLRCLKHAIHAPDYIGRLICIGVSSQLMFQCFANIGVATNILPNTGLPLPFISYGMTSLIGAMIGVGLVLSVSTQERI